MTYDYVFDWIDSTVEHNTRVLPSHITSIGELFRMSAGEEIASTADDAIDLSRVSDPEDENEE